MRPASNQTRGAFAALFITMLLLVSASWNLYNEPSAALIHDPITVPNNAQPPSIKAAAILETRPLDNLIPLILHFSAVLGQEWPIHVFTSAENRMSFRNSGVMCRKIGLGEIVLRDLPVGVPDDFKFHEHYLFSEFLIQPWFWEELAPAEQILMFRADSMICSKSEKSLDDFLEYDFIGAALKGEDGEDGVKGGLSLRNRTKMLDIVQNSDWQNERHGEREPDGTPKIDHESRWFWKKLKKLPLRGFGEIKVNIPSMEVAGSFVVGDTWEGKPFGIDHVHEWEEEEMNDILKWCPEYQLAMSGTKSVDS